MRVQWFKTVFKQLSLKCKYNWKCLDDKKNSASDLKKVVGNSLEQDNHSYIESKSIKRKIN